MAWSKKIAIVGIGETNVGVVPNRTSLQMYAEVAKKAIEDAGLKREDIDGVITGGTFLKSHFMQNAVFYEYLRLRPRYSSTLPLGGMTYCHAVMEAASAISAGLAEIVLVVAADPFLSAGKDAAIAMMAAFFDHQYELPFGFVTPAMFALAARRHMHEYGTTREQLAQVAVSARKHASLNPLAQFRKPITIEDVLSSKEICSPLRLLDCSPVSDGGAAIIVTTAERARVLKKQPVYLVSGGEAHELEYTDRDRDLTKSAAITSGRIAFEMAGLKPSDVDFAEIYDCFTITLLVHLEDLGFCKKGEGGAFVEGERIEIGGDLPVNTHGGLLSHGHPGVPAGLFHIIEAVKQFRGEVEPERQVPDPEVCLVHGNSGLFRNAATIILSKSC